MAAVDVDVLSVDFDWLRMALKVLNTLFYFSDEIYSRLQYDLTLSLSLATSIRDRQQI